MANQSKTENFLTALSSGILSSALVGIGNAISEEYSHTGTIMVAAGLAGSFYSLYSIP